VQGRENTAEIIIIIIARAFLYRAYSFSEQSHDF